MKRETFFSYASILGLALLFFVYGYPANSSGAFDVYRGIAANMQQIISGVGTPVISEYPPLASALFFVLEYNIFQLPFTIAWLGLIILCLVGIAFYARKYLLPQDMYTAGIALALAIFVLGADTTLGRYDIFLMLLFFLTWKTFSKKRFRDSAFFLAIAVSLKVIPIILLPLLFIGSPVKQWRQIVTGTLAGLALSLAIPIMIFGVQPTIENIQHVATYHGSRGVHLESTLSNIHTVTKVLLGHDKIPPALHHKSAHNGELTTGHAAAATVIVILGLLLLYYGAWCKRRKNHLDTKSKEAYFFMISLWAVATSPLVSPQHLMWFYPLILIWLLDNFMAHKVIRVRYLLIFLVMLALGVATHWIWPLHYNKFLEQTTLSIVVHTVRNACFFLGIFLIYKEFCSSKTKKAHKKARKSEKVPSKKHGIQLFAMKTVLFIAALSVLLFYHQQSTPPFSSVQYRFEGGQEHEAFFPISLTPESPILHMRTNIVLPKLYPRFFTIKPDDCIESFFVNDIEVDKNIGQFCHTLTGRRIDLSEYLHAGKNTFKLTIRDEGGVMGANISISKTSPLLLFISTAILILLVLYGGMFFRLSVRRTVQEWSLYFIFIFGSLARFLYVLATSYNTRGHDTGGHIEYIKYFLRHWRIPDAVAGWELHQAPLYYFISAVWWKVNAIFGRAQESLLLHDLQVGALLLSIGTLAVCVWIAYLLFPRKENILYRTLFVAILAVLPGLVFVSARISNDTLFTFLMFLSFALLLRWWKTGKKSDWYILCISLGINAITKGNFALILPAVFIPFVLRKKFSWRYKLKHGVLACLLLFLISGWLPIMRFMEETPHMIPFGNSGLNGGLFVTREPVNFLTFNPQKIIDLPYNDPWNDAARRQYFWEYLYRSAFFGEFHFNERLKDLSQLILIFGCFLMALSLFGLWKDLRHRAYKSLPVWLSLGSLLAGLVAYSIKTPCSCNQDFRFIPLVAAPIAYFVIQGARLLPSSLERKVAVTIIVTFIVLCGMFLLFIPLYS
jgi:hypothetical protein